MYEIHCLKMKTMSHFYCPRKTVIQPKTDTTKNKRAFHLRHVPFITAVLLLLVSNLSFGQLGTYEFTQTAPPPPGTCPASPDVTTQPANAVFSAFTTVNTTCKASSTVYKSEDWNENGSIDLNEYNQFTITANANYVLNLTSLTFTQEVDKNGSGSGNGNTAWILRSSVNNYATNLATGSATENSATPTVTLPSASFSALSTVTFRLYLINAKDDHVKWSIDDVSLDGSIFIAPADPADPTSDSPQCSNPGVTITSNGSAPAGETWYWQTSATGTSTANSGATYLVTTSGTYYIRSQDNTTSAWSTGAGSVTITITPDVVTPVFSLGASSTRCESAGTVTYGATASNNTGITYSLDATSLSDGNSIDANTGDVTYVAGWTGASIITATATGCNGPTTATHTVNTNAAVGTPVFTSGATSSRCQGSGTVTYTATANNSSGITYSLDALSITGGNSINSTTGAVTYAAGWSGTSTITATAAGCGGPTTETHTITINPSVGTPVFTSGATSTMCQGSTTQSYVATAVNNTGLTYSLDAASITAGNSINSTTGDVTYDASWSGTSVITATATGCGGPKTANHTVTITPSVGTPVFSSGATSTRCQGTGTVTYTATASNNTGRTYSLDAASISGGLTINASTGAVTYVAGWSGTTVITVTASGCNGPTTATHTVTVTPTVGTPVFTAGSSSMRCLGVATVNYAATATNSTAITYSLDGASLFGGNTINSTTGDVTFAFLWFGSSTITATATGCNGPKTATHTVTVNAAVSTPSFSIGFNFKPMSGSRNCNLYSISIQYIWHYLYSGCNKSWCR